MERGRKLVVVHGRGGVREGSAAPAFTLVPGALALVATAVGFASGVFPPQAAGIGAYASLVLLLNRFLRKRRRQNWENLCRIFPAPASKSTFRAPTRSIREIGFPF